MDVLEVVERLLRVGRERDVDAFVEIMAPDGWLEFPFSPDGAPVRLNGRGEIRAFLTQVERANVAFDEHRNLVVHRSTDPEVVIVEYDAHGRVVTTGAAIRQTVIAVLRVRDGQVLSYRDYVNPMVLLAARAEG